MMCDTCQHVYIQRSDAKSTALGSSCRSTMIKLTLFIIQRLGDNVVHAKVRWRQYRWSTAAICTYIACCAVDSIYCTMSLNPLNGSQTLSSLLTSLVASQGCKPMLHLCWKPSWQAESMFFPRATNSLLTPLRLIQSVITWV